MTQKIVQRMVLSAALLAMGAAMGVASAAEAQQTATYQVQKADGQSQKIVIVAEDDGSYVVLVDGARVEGAEAAQVLADNGIVVSVTKDGQIVTKNVSKSVQVVVAPKDVAVSASVPVVVPSLPSNTMAGSGLACSGAAQGTQDRAVGMPAVKPLNPISGK